MNITKETKQGLFFAFSFFNVLALALSYLLKSNFVIFNIICSIISFHFYASLRDDLSDNEVKFHSKFFISSILSFIFSTIHAFCYSNIYLSMQDKASYYEGYQSEIYGSVASTAFFVSFLLNFILIAIILFICKDKKMKEKVVSIKDVSYSNLPFVKKDITAKSDEPDVVLFKDEDTNEDVVLQYKSRCLHSLVLGPTGCGKTSKILLPMILQDIQRDDIGITVVDPKGDLAADVWALGKHFGKDVIFFNPIDPNPVYFNPLEGPDEDSVIESVCTTFRMLSQDSSQFFQDQNENLLRNALKAMKRLEAYDPVKFPANLITLSRLVQNVEGFGRKMMIELSRIPCANAEEKKENTDIISWFNGDYFTGAAKSDPSEGQGVRPTKTYEHCSAVRTQLSRLTSNKYLRKCLVPPIGMKSISFSDHLENGGILSINSCQGELGSLSKMLGLFLILQFQAAVFKRPGNENTRRPHFLFLDEVQEFINPAMGILLTQGRSYRVGCVLCTQALRQLAVGQGGNNFLSLITTNARNIILFPGIDHADADYYSKMFGEEKRENKREIYKEKPFNPIRGNFNIFDRDYHITYEEQTKLRYSASDIRYKDFDSVSYLIIKDNILQRPGVGITSYIPPDVYKAINEIKEERAKKIESEQKDIDDNSKNDYDRDTRGVPCEESSSISSIDIDIDDIFNKPFNLDIEDTIDHSNSINGELSSLLDNNLHDVEIVDDDEDGDSLF